MGSVRFQTEGGGTGPLFKKMWGPFTFFQSSLSASCQVSVLLKNWRPFFTHYSRGLPIIWYFGHAKNSPLLLRGHLFEGAPVRPNMLNMPKPAAGRWGSSAPPCQCLRTPMVISTNTPLGVSGQRPLESSSRPMTWVPSPYCVGGTLSLNQ